MRRAAKVDANQPAIVDAARKMGFSVAHTHTLGDGFPDLALGKYGFTFLVEVKDGSKPKSERQLNANEEKWHDAWHGHKAVIENLDDLIALKDYADRLFSSITYYPSRRAEGAHSDYRVKPTSGSGTTV